jgi:hypothetical protein
MLDPDKVHNILGSWLFDLLLPTKIKLKKRDADESSLYVIQYASSVNQVTSFIMHNAYILYVIGNLKSA